jgi:hypothetical protein
MATSTLIQYLAQNQTSGLGVSVPVGAGASNRSQEETFIAGGTISKGDFVSLDTSKTGADKALFVVTVDTSGGAVALGVPTVGRCLCSWILRSGSSCNWCCCWCRSFS